MTSTPVTTAKPKNEIWATTKWFASGAISGMCNTIAGHTLKVRLQTEGTKGRFNGVLHCLKKTVVEEGFFRGLYKGISPPFWGMGIINMSMFGFFGEARKWVATWNKKPISDLTIGEVCVAGGITGVLVSAVVVPVEQVKARLQIQYALPPGQKPQYSGAIDCCRQLIRNNGIFGMFRGYEATIMTRGHCWAYFGGQEIARQYYVKKSGKPDYKLNSYEQFMSGGFSGTTYWLVAYPFDVVKNRLMSQPDVVPLKYPTVLSAWKHIWKVDGIRGFGVGFIPAAMRTLPANGITWLALQYVQDFLQKFDHVFDK